MRTGMVRSHLIRARLAGCCWLASFAVALCSCSRANMAPAKATTQPSTRAAQSRPATSPVVSERDRLLGVRKAVIAARDYAKAHDQTLPTTEQLAHQMGTTPDKFEYEIVLRGRLDQHLKRVDGDWPEVLIREKHGGTNGKWAFGFVDGLCTLQTIASYKEMGNQPALKNIEPGADAR